MMKYYLPFVLMLVLSIVLLPCAIAVDVEMALEAELANKIQAPMVIAVPADAKAQGGPEPDAPSNDKFIWAPDKPVNGGPNGDRGFAEFIINIPQKGKYTVWGKVIAWDGNSDSFWVTWTPADPAENPQATGNTTYRWSTAQGPAWHWDRINQWLNGGTFEREWEFDKGVETKLTIWTREDATMLDCLFITSKIAGDAGSAGARVPTEEDRKAQIEGKMRIAVDAAGKLSATWGGIKSQYSN